jgi:hypothetical protein
MPNLVRRGRKAAATSLALSIVCVAALALPATGFAAPPEGGEGSEGPPPQLAFNPGVYDFGVQRVNRGEASANFELANVGEAATQLSGVGIDGPGHDHFWTNGGDCMPGRWLQPGESCSVQVGFNPTDTVAYAAELQAYADGTVFSAQLSGFGGRPAVEASANPFDFGALPVGTPGPVTPVVLTNHGNVGTAFFIAVIAGGSVSSFQLIDENCTMVQLGPEESCTVWVRFVPQVTGTRTARLALFGDDDGGAMVALSGEGLEPSAASAPPATPGSAINAPLLARRGKQRRFSRGTTLHAGQARCYAIKCRKALRAREAVGG